LPAKPVVAGKAGGCHHGSGQLSDAQLNTGTHIQDEQEDAAMFLGHMKGDWIPEVKQPAQQLVLAEQQVGPFWIDATVIQKQQPPQASSAAVSSINRRTGF
jgi:hypothetical protein